MARLLSAVLAAAMATGFAAPAVAQQHNAASAEAGWQSGSPDAYQGSYQGGYPTAPMPYGPATWQTYSGPVAYPQVQPQQPPAEADPRYREMLDRCQGVTRRNSGVAGAVIGGVIGGVVGNRVISGDRTLGTVAGVAVGAAAGTAVGRAADRSRERECEQFFSTYTPANGPSGPGYAPAPYLAYGYAPYGYIMVPVAAAPVVQQPCTETRTETVEYVPVTVRHGYVPHRPIYRDKRVKEKRVYTGS